MDNIGKIVGINLVLFLLYTLLIHVSADGDAAILGSMVAYVHAGGILLIGLFMAIFGKHEERSKGGGYILAGLLIAVIGFSICLGTLDLHI